MTHFNCKKDLFGLTVGEHYINGAYMSPLLLSSEQAGIEGIRMKIDPSRLSTEDFFVKSEQLRNAFGQLVHCNGEDVAIIPSVSYGLQAVMGNLDTGNGNEVVSIMDVFPSDFYAMERWTKENDASLNLISPDQSLDLWADDWNNRILEAISEETCIVLIPHIHWMYGNRFDLQAIGEKCRQKGAYLIVDGTQSVGILPIDVQQFNIDALICAGYKWLLGPYSIGAAYYGERLKLKAPLEESWINRSNARDFTSLTNYTNKYMPGAGRFNVGETSNFILTPMFLNGIQHLLDWTPEVMQAYCEKLINPLLDYLKDQGISMEVKNNRAAHLLGIKLPDRLNPIKLSQDLKAEKIHVSVRGNRVRVAPNVYNDQEDIDALIQVLSSNL